jgi:uncharacterized protein (TIGR03437 family)
MRATVLLLAMLCAPLLDAQQVSTARRQQDLDFIANQLPRLHANFFFQLDPAQFQQAVNALSAKLATATDAEFYVGLSQLVALAGDAHTALAFTGNAATAIGFRVLPLQFRWLDDGVFVTGAGSAYARALGAQLIAVGGSPIDQVVQQLATVIPHANDQWLHNEAAQFLTYQQILQGLHVVPVASASDFTFRTLSGDSFVLSVAPADGALLTAPDPAAGLLPAYLQQATANYWYTYFPKNRLLYFKYNRCADDPANPFSTFSAGLLQTVDSNPVDTFVFDFRGNPGGDSSLINVLGNGLAQRYPTLLANPRLRIYDVIDKGTFSSGMDDAMAIKQPLPSEITAFFPNVDFTQLVRAIGEPTGGKPAEYGEVKPFTLPGSGLPGQYSTTYFPNPPYIPDLPSFMPDIPVSIRSTDFFARHDPVMAAMLAGTNSAPAQPSGDVIAVNAASFRADQGLAPGSFAAAFGTFSSNPDQVLVAGLDAKLVSSAASQVNFVVPATLSPGSVTISVRAGGRELAAGRATLTPSGPAIFVLNPADPSQPGAVENQDYSVNSSANPAAAGSVVQIFATGNGALDASGSAPVQVLFGDTPAQVLYSAPLAQYPGLWQINAQVPSGITGQVPLSLVASPIASNGVTIYVH